MKTIIILLATLTIISATYSQPNTAREAKLKSQIIALEKAGWQAWKEKHTTWFQKNTTAECLWITADGITDKAQMIKSTSSDCDVKSVFLDSFRFVKLNDKTVLLTYIANQDGSCGGTKLSSKLRVSVNYIYRAGKWLEAFYMETSITASDR